MTNPTKPLDIEARELLATESRKRGDGHFAKRIEGGIGDQGIFLAVNVISELLTRLREVEKDRYIRFTDAMNKLEMDNTMMSQRLKVGELEYMRCQAEKLSNYQALLEECRRVFGRISRVANRKPPWPDLKAMPDYSVDIIVMAAGTNISLCGIDCDVRLSDFLSAVALIEKLDGK